MISGFVLVNWDDGALDMPVSYYASWEAVVAEHKKKGLAIPAHPDEPQPKQDSGYRPTSGYKYKKIQIFEPSDFGP